MPCKRIPGGFVCTSRHQKIGDYIVEFPPTGSPVAIKPNGDIYERIPGGMKKFYDTIYAWKAERKK